MRIPIADLGGEKPYAHTFLHRERVRETGILAGEVARPRRRRRRYTRAVRALSAKCDADVRPRLRTNVDDSGYDRSDGSERTDEHDDRRRNAELHGVLLSVHGKGGTHDVRFHDRGACRAKSGTATTLYSTGMLVTVTVLARTWKSTVPMVIPSDATFPVAVAGPAGTFETASSTSGNDVSFALGSRTPFLK